MIDKNKQYRTRDGREVRIYATDGANARPIHGAVGQVGEWISYTWMKNGKYSGDFDYEHPRDLIEVKPRIKREVWVNVYPNGVEAYSTRHSADFNTEPPRIACVKLTIDCEEGGACDDKG